MAITVKLTDATVSVGGDFGRALSFIKGLPGRRYDGATKTNSVALSLADFRAAALHGYTFEIVSGANAGAKVAQHGNVYTRSERDAYGATRDAEKRIAAEYAPRFDALDAELRRRATEAGIPAQVVGWIERFEIEDMVECGRLQFSSDARRQQVETLGAWYDRAYHALYQERDDVRDTAERDIYAQYGIV